MQKIVPCLWYNEDAEAAMRLYASVLPDSEIGRITRFPTAGTEIHGRPTGSVMTVEATLGGRPVMALNGGPQFIFTPAISLFITVSNQPAMDRIWNRLVEGGSVLLPPDRYPWAERFGWLADRWGFNWQITVGAPKAGVVSSVPALLFVGDKAGRAGEAIRSYAEIFAGSTVDEMLLHDEGGPDTAGTVRFASFRLAGEPFVAMDSAAGHAFDFNEAVSLTVNCEDQAEIDRLWSALSAVPQAEQCGWVKDRFGVSWQIVPSIMGNILAGGESAARDRAMEAMMTMKKIDIAALKAAWAG